MCIVLVLARLLGLDLRSALGLRLRPSPMGGRVRSDEEEYATYAEPDRAQVPQSVSVSIRWPSLLVIR